jgi:flagella basal body P-ring formation protein FlgA
VILAAALLAAVVGTDTLVLKEKAGVAGRYVRLLDILDADRLGEATRLQVEGVYLGRAPEEGRTRTITAEEVRRELERRGFDPAGFVFVGEKVEVGGAEPRVGEEARSAITFEIKRIVIGRRAGIRPAEVAVRITYMHPEALPEDCRLLSVRACEPADAARAEFVATFEQGPEARKIEVEVIARILQAREVAFAVRELPPGKVLERADIEMKRLECAGDENYAGDLPSLVGGTALVRIRKGTAISTLDVKMKPVIKRGDVVRALSEHFEADARAVEDGVLGGEATFEFLATKIRFRGKVLGPAQVRVAEGGR